MEFFPNFEGVKRIENAVAIGQNAGVGSNSSVTIGDHAVTTGVNGIAQGKQAIAMGDNSVAIGNQALAAKTSKTSQELQALKQNYDTAKDNLAKKQRDLNSANRNLERKPDNQYLIAKQAEAQTALDEANVNFTKAKTDYDTAFANTTNLNAIAIGNTSQEMLSILLRLVQGQKLRQLTLFLLVLVT